MTSTSNGTAEVRPDLAATNRAQQDLLELCRERPQPKTELFHPNSFYGIAGILRRYARLHDSYPVAAVIPHGVFLDPSFVWRAEIDAKVPGVLSFPEYRDAVYETVTSKRVIPSASPYIYLVRMLEPAPEIGRKGTIFFPSHSTHHVTSLMRPESIADQLSQVDERFRPITVCMYWRDIQLGRHTAFTKRGFKVVSAGHIFDDGFLYRLHWLCSQHTYSSGNVLGSHAFLSVESGCVHVGLLGTETAAASLRAQETSGTRVPTDAGKDIVAKAVQTFMSPNPDLQEQKRLVDYFLRRDWALPPDKLASLLKELRYRDRWGFRTDSGFRWNPPGWIRRSLPARGLRFIHKRLMPPDGR